MPNETIALDLTAWSDWLTQGGPPWCVYLNSRGYETVERAVIRRAAFAAAVARKVYLFQRRVIDRDGISCFEYIAIKPRNGESVPESWAPEPEINTKDSRQYRKRTRGECDA